MTDRTATRVEAFPNLGGKVVVLKSGTTVTAGTDTVTLTLADFGITNVLGFEEFVHTTDYSVIVAGSTSLASVVSAGVLTVTLSNNGGDSSTDNKRRVVVVYGE